MISLHSIYEYDFTKDCYVCNLDFPGLRAMGIALGVEGLLSPLCLNMKPVVINAQRCASPLSFVLYLLAERIVFSQQLDAIQDQAHKIAVTHDQCEECE